MRLLDALKSLLVDLNREMPGEGWLASELAEALKVPLPALRLELHQLRRNLKFRAAHLQRRGRPPTGYCWKG